MASDWREKYQKAIKDGSAAKRYQESSKGIPANNPAFVYAKVYGDGKTGQEANKPVKGKKITKPPKVQHRDGEIAALGAGDYGASNSTRFDKTMNAAIYSTAAALENLHGTLKEKDARQRARDEADSKRLKAGYDAMIQGEDIYSRPGGLKKISEDADKDFEARYEKVRGVGDEYFKKADEMKKRSEQQQKEAKEGLGGFGQFAVDLGIAGAQFAGDIALNAALPGAGLAAMGMRAAGSAAQEARQDGRDIDTQLNTGLKSAAIEVLTEKLFGLGSKAAYGSGLIKNEKLINGIVNNLAKTNAGRTTLKLITGAAEEGAEEVLSDILNPVADRILKLDDGKGDWSDIGKDMDTQQMLADFLIGGTLGLFGAGTNVVNGQFKAENAQQRGYEKYQRELVNMGLEAEPGSRAQKAAETYKPIVEKSGKHFHRNLSDAETENLARLMDAPFAKKALADANILIDDNTADIIARAANGQRISQSERERLQKIPNIGEVINEVALAGVKARALERTFTQELQPDGITLPRGDELLRDKTIESAERLSKITGREIRLYDADPSENGYYDRATGELYINRNSKNPLAQVVGHELTHSIEDAGAYTDLKSVIFSQIQKQGGDLAKMRQEKAALYEKHGHTLGSEEEIDAEIVAEFVEKNLLTDEASIKAVVTQSPSLGQRILQFINDLLAKIGDRKAQERAFLTKARGYYQTALREIGNRPVNVTFKAEAPTQAAPAAKTTQAQTTQTTQEAAQEAATREASQAQEAQAKSSEMTPDEYLESLRDQLARGEISEDEFSDLFDEYYNGGTERQYSFAGQKASTANLEHLKNAQEMETLGADMKSIRKATGWFKGMDGKWRFEIDDSEMTYHRGGDAAFSRGHPDYAEYQKLMRKWMTGEVTAEEETRLRQMDETWGREYGRLSERVDRGNATLEDILDHEALFRAYPQLRRTKVEFADMPKNTMGSYSPSQNLITLSNELRNAPESTLVHEIQHAIQNAEGFTRGSNREYWEEKLTSGDKIQSKGFQDARKKLIQFQLDKANEEALALKDKIEQAGELDDDLTEYDRLWEEAERRGLDGKINEYYDLLDNYYTQMNRPGNSVPSELYYSTAGEIEARDAASRRTLTPEERKNKSPNLGDENIVFAEDEASGRWYSAEEYDPETASIKEQIAHSKDELNKMSPVAEKTVPKTLDRAADAFKWVEEMYASIAYTVHRDNFGDIRVSRKDISKGLRYAKTPEERAGIALVPEVLKYGREIGAHENHKGRSKSTITFAGPVVMNGVRGNMAVLVNRNNDNYNAHRIVMPDGSVFKFSDEKIDTTPERSQGVAQTRSLAETADAVSENSIPTNTQSVNKQFSVSERTPDQKKEILAQARRYASGEIGKDEFFRHMDRIDGTRRSAPSRNAYRQPPKNQSYSDEAREIYDRAHSEGVSVDEYLRRNWEEFDIDGRWSDAAQEALRMDGRRYSVEEETANEEEPKEPRVRDTIPKKAETYLKRAEGALVKDLSDKLNVPKFAQKEYLNEIAQEISEEYLKTGMVSEETKNELFETAWENGRHIDDEFYNTYKDIKDYLKTQSVTLSETDKADITDWNQFKNSAFGSLRIVNKGGLPVDTAYQELQGMAPELFPPDITHPADQIQRMLEVSKSISVSEKSLDDHFGRNAEEYKKWARADFETAITDSLSALRTVKRYVEDGKAPAEKLHTIDEVQNAYKGLKEARKKYEIANAKNLLTDHDKIQVGRLLRGEIELEHLDPKQDNVKGISAVFEAQEEYERISRTIREWNAQRKQELRDEADEYLQTANDWKDKKSGILYARETQERNVLDIVPDEKIAKAINRKYFMPVHQAEAKSTQFKKTMRGKVAALKLSTKETKAMKKAGKVSEAHAVQLIGEARDNAEMASRSRDKTRDGKTEAEWRAIEAELWKNNPDLDKAKIENAIKEFRGIYDELLNMMNDVRIENGYEPVNYRRGYFPHFKKESADNIIGLFGRALGIKTDVTELPTTINGMTHMFRPGIQWFGNALERTGFETTYDAVEGFDRYIEGVANVIYQTENIQRLRALASQARYRTGPEGLRKQIDAVRADTQLNEAQKKAIEDDLKERGKYKLSNWVVNLDEYTNILAGKKSMADRNLEQALGRDMYNVVKAVESRVAANMVAINVGSWLTNFIPITQGYALLGTKDLLTGMKQTLAAMKESDGMVEASAFLTNRIGSDPLVQTWAQKASAKLSSPMSWIDNFTAGTLVRARYNQNIRQGMSEAAAMEDADTFAANVMADRSKGSTPTLFNQSNPVTKLFTQFQLEVNNQLSYLFKDIPRETKDKGVKALALALLKFFLGAYLYDEAYEYFIGRRPALDPIGILVDTAQDIANGESAYDVITGTLEDTAEQLPFIGGILGGGRIPISSALPDAGNLLRAATNEDWDSKKRWSTIGKELAKPATYTLLPFGGGQIKKVAQGIDATIRGGSYTYDADGNDILQYPVYNQSFGDSAKSIAESVLFGKTALPTGREWIGSGFKSFGAKETAAYKELTESGTSQKDVYDTLKAIRAEKTNNGKRTAISDSSLTDNEKRILYNHIFGEKHENGTYKSTRTEEIAAFKEAGLDMDDFLKAQNQYTDIGKEYDTTSDKALAFSRWVNQQGWTADQKAAVNDSFKYYSQIPATAANYNSFADAGLSDETAYKLAKAINDLEPQDGADTVSSTQKWRAVVDTVKNTNDQLAALAQVMSESEYRKVSAGRAHGVEPSSYVAFKESLPKFDADGNGTFKQAEIKAAIDAMGEKYGTVLPGGSKLTIAQQAVLWQLANKSWKPKNNPYSVAIGQKVYNELNAK